MDNLNFEFEFEAQRLSEFEETITFVSLQLIPMMMIVDGTIFFNWKELIRNFSKSNDIRASDSRFSNYLFKINEDLYLSWDGFVKFAESHSFQIDWSFLACNLIKKNLMMLYNTGIYFIILF